MIVIPIEADVECSDGHGGVSSHIIFNPSTRQLTHYVVRERGYPHIKRLVEVHWVLETTPELIRLRCTREQLAAMASFVETEYVRRERPDYNGFPLQETLWMSDAPTFEEWLPLARERVPAGEQALSHGAHVHATDGYVGRVHDFLADPTTGRITHLVLARGHLWGKREVAIPVSMIHEIDETAVYLELDERAVNSLPNVPTRHRYAWISGADVELITVATEGAGAADEALKTLQQLDEEGVKILNAGAVVIDDHGRTTSRRSGLAETEYDALFDDVVRGLTGLSAGAPGSAPIRTGTTVSRASASVHVQQETRVGGSMAVALVGEEFVERVCAALAPFFAELTRQPLTDEVVTQIISVGSAAELVEATQGPQDNKAHDP